MEIFIQGHNYKISEFKDLNQLLHKYLHNKFDIADQFLNQSWHEIYYPYSPIEVINILEALPEYNLKILKKFITQFDFRYFIDYWQLFQPYFERFEGEFLPELSKKVGPEQASKLFAEKHAPFFSSPENVIAKLNGSVSILVGMDRQSTYYQRIRQWFMEETSDPELQKKFCDSLRTLSGASALAKHFADDKFLEILMQHPKHRANLIRYLKRDNLIATVNSDPDLIDDLISWKSIWSIRFLLNEYPELKETLITYTKQHIEFLYYSFQGNDLAGDFHDLIRVIPELTLECIAGVLITKLDKSFLFSQNFRATLAQFNNEQDKRRMLEYFFTISKSAREFSIVRLFNVLYSFLQLFNEKEQETQRVLEEFLVERLQTDQFLMVTHYDVEDLKKLPIPVLQRISTLLGERTSYWQHFTDNWLPDSTKLGYMLRLQHAYPNLADFFLNKFLAWSDNYKLYPFHLSDLKELVAEFPQKKELIADIVIRKYVHVEYFLVPDRWSEQHIEFFKDFVSVFSSVNGFTEKLTALLRCQQPSSDRKAMYIQKGLQCLSQLPSSTSSIGNFNFFSPDSLSSGKATEISKEGCAPMDLG